MNVRLKHFLPVGIFTVMVVVFYLGLYRDPTLVPSPFIGKPAPAFDLPELYDPQERITHEEFQGQISLFNVWASWCPGCAQEHAMLNAIAWAKDTGRNDFGLLCAVARAWRDKEFFYST